MPRPSPTPTLRDDLLIGAAAIARYSGLSERQVYHFIGRGELPVRRLGRLLVARKSELDRTLASQHDDPRR